MGALLLAVMVANSGGGRERLSEVVAGINGTRAAATANAEAAQAAHLARTAAIEADTRRLLEMVRSLAGDRERLTARVSMLERNLQDVTGAVQRQAAAKPTAATPTPAETPAKVAAAPPQVVARAEAAPSSPSSPPEPNRMAGVPPSSHLPELEAIQPRAAGVDIGGAPSFDGLRALWSTMVSSYHNLFEGLHPIVAVRENSRSRAADLRLIAGPLTDVESASRICTTLAAAKRYCRLVTFEGQPLALDVSEPPRRPATAAATVPKARPVTRPAP